MPGSRNKADRNQEWFSQSDTLWDYHAFTTRIGANKTDTSWQVFRVSKDPALTGGWGKQYAAFNGVGSDDYVFACDNMAALTYPNS